MQFEIISTQEKLSEYIASPIEINQALLADETASVIHPVADVDFTLTDDIHVSDDLWQELRQGLTFDIPENKRLIAQRNWWLICSPSPGRSCVSLR